MMIERSADFGRTWRPYRYFASNCTKTFPSIPANRLHHINDIICEERYSDIEPSTNGEVRSERGTESSICRDMLDWEVFIEFKYEAGNTSSKSHEKNKTNNALVLYVAPENKATS